MPVTLCFIKDKHKVMEHKIPLETYFAGLLQKVEWQIQEYEDTAADTLTLCRLCVDYLQEILGELKNFIISYPFASTEEEIHFFKEVSCFGSTSDIASIILHHFYDCCPQG